MFLCVYDSAFERSAFGLLEELHKCDGDKTEELVQRPLKTWKKTSVYQLAVDADLKEFKTHDSLQANLDKMWRGRSTRKLWQVGLHVYHLTLIANVAVLS